MTSSTAPITIRRATSADTASIERLAALDSRRAPAGPHLVALSDDRFVAAASLRDGAVVADPFVASAAIVELLRERAGHLAGEAVAPARRGLPALALLRGLFPPPAGPRPSRSS